MASKLQPIINVGNVLNLIDIKKKVGQNVAGEVSLEIVIRIAFISVIINIFMIDFRKFGYDSRRVDESPQHHKN